MRQIEKNTVEAKNQLKTNTPIFYENKEGKGKRVLFVGNSITLHGYKPDIGWFGENYGMAASCKENDYVHLVMKKIRESDPDAVSCIAQIADWETHYREGEKILAEKFEEVLDFQADIIVFRFVENVSWKDYDREVFYKEFYRLVEYFNGDKRAKIILTTGFWKHPADEEIVKVGKDIGIATVYLGDLGEWDEMKALGAFAHEGVANHPGDKGMRAIADRIIKAMQ